MKETKIIAEIGYNAGETKDLKLAYEFISSAIKAGAWAVKFQKWDIENIPEKIKQTSRDLKDSFGDTYYKHRKAVEYTIEQLKKLRHEALIQGAEFIISGKDYNSIVELVTAGFTHIKIPSQLAFDRDIYEYLKGKLLTIYVSFGMCNESDYKYSPWWKELTVNKFHCHSEYPVDLHKINFSVFQKYDFNGYSSHDLIEFPTLHLVGIVDYIERHFTIDKDLKGRDNATVSSDEAGFQLICDWSNDHTDLFKDRLRKMTKQEQKISDFYKGALNDDSDK